MARKAPVDGLEKDTDLIQEYLRRCGVSRESRRANGAALRQWYETGSEDGYPARYNKLQAHLDRLQSYLWSPDALRFGVHLPPAVKQEWLSAAATARDEFRQTWAISGADSSVGLGVEWALVYGAVPYKVQQDPDLGFTVSEFDPWDFGVTREDQPGLEDQDVLAHWYTLSMPQFERWCAGHPRETSLIERASKVARQPTGGTLPTRLVISGITGAFPGSSVSGAMPGDAPTADQVMLDAQVIEPVIDLVDVWERRHYTDPVVRTEYEDWRVTTCLVTGNVPLLRRRNPILPWLKTASGAVMSGELPFGLLVPRPLPSYLWGRPEIASLLALQAWRERHMGKMDEVIARQLDPAKFFTGPGDWEEFGRALSVVGGSAGAPDASSKMELIKVEVGQEPFALLSQIDSMFDDQAGMTPAMRGQGQPGVRSEAQLITQAGIGAGRVRSMALQLEQTLSRLATLSFRVLQRGDSQTYTAPDGTRFLLAQLPPGLSLQVSAHSASPIFQEQTQAKAIELLKAGAIDGEWFAELLDPPYREEIKAKARELAAARQQSQQQLIMLELARLERRMGKGPRLPRASATQGSSPAGLLGG